MGYLKTIHFSAPVVSGGEIKKTMTIWVDSGNASKVDMRGFFGVYDVTATANGKTVETQIHLIKGAANTFKIVVA